MPGQGTSAPAASTPVEGEGTGPASTGTPLKTPRSALKGARAAAAAAAAEAPRAKSRWPLRPSLLGRRRHAVVLSPPGAASSSSSAAAPSSSSTLGVRWRKALHRPISLPPAKPLTHHYQRDLSAPLSRPVPASPAATTIAAFEARPPSLPLQPLYGSMAPPWTSSSAGSSKPMHPWAESKHWLCCACEAETMVESDVCANLQCAHRRCGGTRGAPVEGDGCRPQDQVEREKWW